MVRFKLHKVFADKELPTQERQEVFATAHSGCHHLRCYRRTEGPQEVRKEESGANQEAP